LALDFIKNKVMNDHPLAPFSSDTVVAKDIAAAYTHAKRLTLLAYIGIGVAILVVMVYAIWFRGPLSADPAAWGQFGDYVGGVLNPTFSFLALLALLATFGLQVRELRISAKELKNSADALVKQNETLRRQTFEATFFQLLRLHNEIVLAIEIPSRSLRGRAAFQFFLEQLEGQLIKAAGRTNLLNATDNFERVASTYNDFYREYEAVLGHYFRMLYNIIKLVHRAEGIDKRFYTNLVRAQLSSAELKLLFYNCLMRWGAEKFKPLVELYSLLKTVPADRPPTPSLVERYSPAAFGGQYPKAWTQNE
jgi:Putative phage abortive infection protein